MARQPRPGRGTPAAAHSYLHVVRKNGIHPYIKRLGLAADRKAAAAPWKVTDLLKAYDWPSDAPGRGVIAIVELGGGWVQSDVDQFFKGVDLPAPHITDVSVDGTKTASAIRATTPTARSRSTSRSPARRTPWPPASRRQFRVYWAQDIAQAIAAATADGCDVCSISWGADEASWGAVAGDALEQAATAATSAGMVVFAASGDNDSSDGGPGRANVDLPASAPHVIGCGGTKKTKTDETVWNDNPGKTDGEGTGGGYSTLFPMPSWQAGAPHGPGRMVPDVAANADPDTGYEILLYGQRRRSSAAPAPSPRSTPACSRRSERNSASSRRSCI